MSDTIKDILTIVGGTVVFFLVFVHLVFFWFLYDMVNKIDDRTEKLVSAYNEWVKEQAKKEDK